MEMRLLYSDLYHILFRYLLSSLRAPTHCLLLFLFLLQDCVMVSSKSFFKNNYASVKQSKELRDYYFKSAYDTLFDTLYYFG